MTEIYKFNQYLIYKFTYQFDQLILNLFLFLQCGIVLASLMLIVSSIMSRLACYYLLKSAIFARRRNFEILGTDVIVTVL